MAVEVWRQRNGYWRWAYREGDVRLVSHSEYAGQDAARHSAATAYPRTPIRVREGEEVARARTPRLRRSLEGLLLALIAYHIARRVLGRLPAEGDRER
ncbi:hypothetical protein GBF35_07720 [Nonomuraea phyllanthi]|uniref:hypothetical protein n=1 Tax=Nonomuraea phyllanthi TaxID=2219224 RepID=UPI001293ABA8|nr:hypothetical protein [Nonomuraea phyllanthi]QFY06587.1 hypothetical protein GBF35_07720 [Nonomuraea phyllanthi]